LQNISVEPDLIKEFKLDKKLESALVKITKEKIKPTEVRISATITLQSNAEDGIEVIKKILSNLEKENIEIKYLGAPRYQLIIKSGDYKTAEQILKDLSEEFEKLIKESSCTGKIEREK
jgi:translation initiation factor 2 subunit 1